MSHKIVELPNVGQVHLYKRKGAKHVRLSVGSRGIVRITLPLWAPYKVGIEFALSKADWIRQHAPKPIVLTHGAAIGKKHTLELVQSPATKTVASRVAKDKVSISYNPMNTAETEIVQQAIKKASIRALKKEAEDLLPERLRLLADLHDFNYRSVTVKQLTGRWGSCNQFGDITLNCFLMQLPWHLIDYVLLHELTHTKIMAHGPVFWNELDKHIKDIAGIRKEIRQYQPILQSQ